MNGLRAIFLKVFSHIRRGRSSIVFGFLSPALLLSIFGYAIDLTVNHTLTVVSTLNNRQGGRELLRDVLVLRAYTEVTVQGLKT